SYMSTLFNKATLGSRLLAIFFLLIVFSTIIFFINKNNRKNKMVAENNYSKQTDTLKAGVTPQDSFNYDDCPYSPDKIKLQTKKLYENTSLGFQIEIPSDWYIPSASDTDPHFYYCTQNKSIGDAFEILYYSNKYESIKSASTKLKPVAQLNGPSTENGLVYDHVAINNILYPDADGEEMSWRNAYVIIFEQSKKAYLFMSYNKIDTYASFSFQPIK
ncbi:MAG: hypothetical protein ABL899_01910, partial [Nitrospira sp.]